MRLGSNRACSPSLCASENGKRALSRHYPRTETNKRPWSPRARTHFASQLSRLKPLLCRRFDSSNAVRNEFCVKAYIKIVSLPINLVMCCPNYWTVVKYLNSWKKFGNQNACRHLKRFSWTVMQYVVVLSFVRVDEAIAENESRL